MNRSYLPMLLRPLGCDGPIRVNSPFQDAFELRAEDLRAHPLLEWIHEDDRARFEVAAHARTADEPFDDSIVARHRTKQGNWVAFEWRFEKHDDVLFANGRMPSESESLAVTRPQRADETSSLTDTLDSMARIVEAKNPGMLCSILLVDERGEHIVGGVGPSLPEAYNKAVQGLRIGPCVGSCGTAAFWNMPVVVEDIVNDPLWRDLLPAAKIAGVAACWSHPVVDSDGRVLGAMALYDTKPRAPERHQMDGLEIAAKMVGLAVERDRLEQQLRRTDKMEALGLLAGGIAHDFNNLLAAIIGNGELLKFRVTPGSEVAEMVEEVLIAGQGAAELCRQIQAYAGRGQSSREFVDCNILVREVAALALVATGKDTSIEYALTDADCNVVGDVGQIQSLLLNLITNARDAISPNEGCIKVRTRTRRYSRRELQQMGAGESCDGGEFVEIEVADTGHGIEKATLARIFDPFFSTKSARRGLGLAATQGIMARHRGAIKVSSEVGVGTTFTMRLPRVTVGKQASPDDDRNPIVPQGLRVLIADDDRAAREAVARTLSDAGIEVLSAVDGQQAVAMFLEHQKSIDCVLLDFRMPKMNGGEAMREIHGIEESASVLLMSGYAERELLEQFHAEGVKEVLQKPIRQQTLLSAICAAAASRSLSV